MLKQIEVFELDTAYIVAVKNDSIQLYCISPQIKYLHNLDERAEVIKLSYIQQKLCLCTFYKKSFFISLIKKGPIFVHYIDILLEDKPYNFCFGSQSLIYSNNNSIFYVCYDKSQKTQIVRSASNKPILTYIRLLNAFLITEGNSSEVIANGDTKNMHKITWEDAPYRIYDVGAYICSLQRDTIEIRSLFDERIIQKHEFYSSRLMLSASAVHYGLTYDPKQNQCVNMVYLCEQSSQINTLVIATQMSIQNQCKYYCKLKLYKVVIKMCDAYNELGAKPIDDKLYSKLHYEQSYFDFFISQNYEASLESIKGRNINVKHIACLFMPYIPQKLITSLRDSNIIISVDAIYADKMKYMYQYGDYDLAIKEYFGLVIELLKRYEGHTCTNLLSEKNVYYQMLLQILYVQFAIKLKKDIDIHKCNLIPEKHLIDILLLHSNIQLLSEYLLLKQNYLYSSLLVSYSC